MFQLSLFTSRGFAMGNIAALMLALARGGLQFILIIWLQGIWLPQHGYDFARTPLWAGIYMVPLTIGFFIAGPVSRTSRRPPRRAQLRDPRLVLTGLSLVGLQAIPINFSYPVFALLLLAGGPVDGALRRAQHERGDELAARQPARRRRRDAQHVPELGERALHRLLLHGHHPGSRDLTAALAPHGPHRQGVPPPRRRAISHIPAIGSLFSAFLGINPMQTPARGPVLAQPGVHASVLLGRRFFPSLIESPFAKGLHMAFLVAAGMCFLGAVFTWMRGRGVPTPRALDEC